MIKEFEEKIKKIDLDIFSKSDEEIKKIIEEKKLYYVLVRSYGAGVFAGYLYQLVDEGIVTLLNVRRIWYWDGANSLSNIANFGVKKPESCKFPSECPVQIIYDVIEILKVNEEAKKSIQRVPAWDF